MPHRLSLFWNGQSEMTFTKNCRSRGAVVFCEQNALGGPQQGLAAGDDEIQRHAGQGRLDMPRRIGGGVELMAVIVAGGHDLVQLLHKVHMAPLVPEGRDQQARRGVVAMDDTADVESTLHGAVGGIRCKQDTGSAAGKEQRRELDEQGAEAIEAGQRRRQERNDVLSGSLAAQQNQEEAEQNGHAGSQCRPENIEALLDLYRRKVQRLAVLFIHGPHLQ